jgi:hypothetical protein
VAELLIKSRWYVGFDVGQRVDPSAVAVLEAKYASIPDHACTREVPRLKHELKDYKPSLVVRHLERLPLATPYPQQCEYLAQLVQRPPLEDPHIITDFSGVGRGIFDIFSRSGIPNIRGVTITGGREITKTQQG